jgi:hypothetical protein
MRRFVLAACASCAVAVGAGWFAAQSARADERSPFQLLGTSTVTPADDRAIASGSSLLAVTPVRWGCGYGYGGYGGYRGFYQPYSSYYRGGGYYGGYRPYGGYYGGYGGYGGYYGGFRPGVNLWFGF